MKKIFLSLTLLSLSLNGSSSSKQEKSQEKSIETKSSDSEQNKKNQDALFEAVEKNDIDAVKAALKSGKVDINAKNQKGETPLIIIAHLPNGSKKIAEILIENGAELYLRSKFGQTALDRAIGSGNTSIAELLINKGDVNVKNSSLGLSIAYNRLEMVKLLLDKKLFNINYESKTIGTPLSIAVIYSTFDIKDKTNVHPNDLRMVELLLEKGANVNYVDIKKKTPLKYAILSYNPNLVALLISKGANINYKGENNYTPLFNVVFAVEAVENKPDNKELLDNQIKIAKLLIGKGVDINVKDNSGLSILNYAARLKDQIVFNLLKEWQDYLTEYNKDKKKYVNEFIEHLAAIKKGLTGTKAIKESKIAEPALIKSIMQEYVNKGPFAYFIEIHHPKMVEKYNELLEGLNINMDTKIDTKTTESKSEEEKTSISSSSSSS